MALKDDKILDVEDLTKFFGVSDQTIWRWCKSGKLPAFKIGSQWKVRQSDLNRIINNKVQSKRLGSEPASTLF
jgi:excisionase family DNA binding protein